MTARNLMPGMIFGFNAPELTSIHIIVSVTIDGRFIVFMRIIQDFFPGTANPSSLNVISSRWFSGENCYDSVSECWTRIT